MNAVIKQIVAARRVGIMRDTEPAYIKTDLFVDVTHRQNSSQVEVDCRCEIIAVI